MYAQERMTGEGECPIRGPLPMKIIWNLFLVLSYCVVIVRTTPHWPDRMTSYNFRLLTWEQQTKITFAAWVRTNNKFQIIIVEHGDWLSHFILSWYASRSTQVKSWYAPVTKTYSKNTVMFAVVRLTLFLLNFTVTYWIIYIVREIIDKRHHLSLWTAGFPDILVIWYISVYRDTEITKVSPTSARWYSEVPLLGIPRSSPTSASLQDSSRK